MKTTFANLDNASIVNILIRTPPDKILGFCGVDRRVRTICDEPNENVYGLWRAKSEYDGFGTTKPSVNVAGAPLTWKQYYIGSMNNAFLPRGGMDLIVNGVKHGHVWLQPGATIHGTSNSILNLLDNNGILPNGTQTIVSFFGPYKTIMLTYEHTHNGVPQIPDGPIMGFLDQGGRTALSINIVTDPNLIADHDTYTDKLMIKWEDFRRVTELSSRFKGAEKGLMMMMQDRYEKYKSGYFHRYGTGGIGQLVLAPVQHDLIL